MRRRPHHILARLVCAMAVAAPLHAFAGSDALTDKAATLYDEGFIAYKASKWAEARASFLAAWSLKKHWQIAGSLGDSEAKLGLYRDAAEHVAYFLRTSPPERHSAAVQKLYELARSKVGTLVITVDTAGADIAVDGNVIGKAPLADPLFVEPGHHAIEARLGARVATVEVDAAVGVERASRLALAPGDPPPLVQRRPLWPVVTGAGVTVAALGTGIGLAVAGGGKRTEVEALRVKLGTSSACAASQQGSADCTAIRNAVHARDTLSDVAFGSFVAGGIAAATTVGLVVWAAAGPKAAERRASRLHVLPVVGADGGGVLVRGVW